MNQRISSIDIFRALTMFFMIFVNDLWSLNGVPHWLEHTDAMADAMGFSDVIFPMFLFIVGLSIPFAISNRKAKGDTSKILLGHIAERAIALLLMGFFTVNLESALESGMLISKYVWQILMTIAFFLIWNAYPDQSEKKPISTTLKITGYLLLATLAYLYKGGSPEHITGMQPHWWGILGLIGWTYLIGSLLFLFFGNQLYLLIAFWLLFHALNILEFGGIPEPFSTIKDYVWIVGGGSMPALTMAGIITSTIYQKETIDHQLFIKILLILGIFSLFYGFLMRPFWGISKIRATPAWVGICSGLSFLTYAILYWVCDAKEKQKWAELFKPAGTATLTCYLLPYVWYALGALLPLSLPWVLRTGTIGLAKSIVFSLLIISITGLLTKIGIRIKV